MEKLILESIIITTKLRVANYHNFKNKIIFITKRDSTNIT